MMVLHKRTKSKPESDKLKEMLSLLNPNETYVVIDTESTGFIPNDTWSKLTEVAGVKVCNGKIIDQYSELINPKISISKKITEVTGITNEMVKDKRGYRDVLLDFYSFCKGATLVFHNAKHDLAFLNYFGNKIGLEFNSQCIDTLLLARYVIDKKEITDYKLATLANFFNIDDPNHHRALNDAYVTAQVLLKLMDKCVYIGKNNIIEKLDLSENALDQTKYANVKIYSVSPWCKLNKIYRIYVTVGEGKDYANIFYDFKTKEWGVKDSSFNEKKLNFENIRKDVLAFCELKEEAYSDFDQWDRKVI